MSHKGNIPFAIFEGRIPLNWCYAVLAIIFMFSKILDGLLRWVAAPIVYLPILASLGVVATHTLIILSRLRSPFFAFLSSLLILLGLLIGYGTLGHVSQVAFGFYILIPIIFGAISYKPLFIDYQRWLPTLGITALTVITLGAIIDFKFDVPWSGFSFELGGLQISGSRVWHTHGLERVAGFSRASYSLAGHAILSALLVVSFSSKQMIKILAWLIAGIVIALSTTKGLLIVWLVLLLVLPIQRFLPKSFLMLLLTIAAIVGIAFPITSYYIDFSSFYQKYPYLTLAIDSFRDRMVNVWPMTVQMIIDHGSFWIGRGLGGIGTPQRGYENIYSPADNMFLFLFGVFGMASLLLYIPWFNKLLRLKPHKNRLDYFMYFLMLVTFIYGISNGIIEEPFFAFFLGASFSHLFLFRKAHADQPPVDPHSL